MKIELINKEGIQERIKDLGIGILFVGIGIIIAILMIAWLLYNIFISSKG
jgi:preprotein translocase subunit Sss1